MVSSTAAPALTYCAATPASKDGAVVIAAADPKTVSALGAMGVPRIADLTKAEVADVYQKMQSGLNMHRISSPGFRAM